MKLFLPTPNLMDSVYAHVGYETFDHSIFPTYDHSIKFNRNVLVGLLFCKHLHQHRYIRIDHNAGPGSFADNYQGTACLDCARIIREEKYDNRPIGKVSSRPPKSEWPWVVRPLVKSTDKVAVSNVKTTIVKSSETTEFSATWEEIPPGE